MDASETAAPVSRPGGVTAAAIVAILGSLFILVAAAMFSSFPAPPGPQGPSMRAFAIGMAIFMASLALIGVWTSIGVFNLRPWARTSMLVFAVCLTAMSVMWVAFAALVPIPVPAGRDPNIVRKIQPGLLVIFSIPLAIGVWWLIQFTRPSTKAAFAANRPVGASDRPLSISIIGWLYLLGGVFAFIPVIAKLPMLAAGVVLTGWQAGAAYLLLGAVGAYLGWGLLKLQERERKLAIAYIVLTELHGMVMSFVPSMQAKMIAMQNAMRPMSVPPTPPTSPKVLMLSMLAGLAFGGVAIWFLVRNKPAFTDKQSVTFAAQ